MRGLLPALAIGALACSGVADPKDIEPLGGGAPASSVVGSGSGQGSSAASGSTGSGNTAPAEGICMEYADADLPSGFAPYETTCVTSDPYACAEDVTCETTGHALDLSTGVRVTACIRLQDGADSGSWPDPGARAGLLLRAIGVEGTGEIHVGMTAETEGNGFYVQEGLGAEPYWVLFESLSMDPPLVRGVSICFDGSRLRGKYYYGFGIALELEDGVPVDADRLEFGVEVAGAAGTDVLGRIDIKDVDTFALGSDGCGEFDPPDCY